MIALRRRLHAGLAAAALLIMLAALWAGWVRLGWHWPAFQASLPASHGPLMVGGFLGTLISLERAVAVRRPWAYLAPVFSALGGLALLLGLPSIRPPLAAGLLALGSAGLVAVFLWIVHRQASTANRLMALGALCWLAGNVLWVLGLPIYRLVAWWAAFLILTIAAERLELGRLVRLTRPQERAFLAGVLLLVVGLIISLFWIGGGARLFGLSLIWISIWLWRHDLARRTLHASGLPRFAAICLLSGYVWLGLAGLTGLLLGNPIAGTYYDAWLHSIFLGFVISMIFGHAPIIFPAVLGSQIRFHPGLYLPVALLHASLALRVAADFTLWQTGRLWGGLFNGIAILAFFGLLLAGQRTSREAPGSLSSHMAPAGKENGSA